MADKERHGGVVGVGDEGRAGAVRCGMDGVMHPPEGISRDFRANKQPVHDTVPSAQKGEEIGEVQTRPRGMLHRFAVEEGEPDPEIPHGHAHRIHIVPERSPPLAARGTRAAEKVGPERRCRIRV